MTQTHVQQTPDRAGHRFYTRDACILARALIGQQLVRVMEDGRRLAGKIVETEAYLGIEDRAAHSYGGRRTTRNEAMYARAGTSYVYFTYGMHHCFNVVCGEVDEPIAVLIRALEPTEGLDVMAQNRAARKSDKTLAESDLCSGPAKLCQALMIDKAQDRADLTTDNTIFIERIRKTPIHEQHVVSTPRIGIDYAGHWAHKPLRWYMKGSAHVSPARPGGDGKT